MKLFRKNDLAVILCVVTLIGLLMIPRIFEADKLIAEIYVNGEIEQKIDLNSVEKEYNISPSNNPDIVISIKKGSIRFTHSDCKDKLCERYGELVSAGQSAACLPSKVVISIKGNDSRYDMLTY